MKVKVVILANEQEDDHLPWVKACDAFRDQIEYRVADLTAANWYEAVFEKEFDILLAKPGGLTARFKQLYDERIYILGIVAGHNIFPTPREIFIYENKRFLSFWLKAVNVPHPDTKVFYHYSEAIEYIRTTGYPFVAKTGLGASGSGVSIIKSPSEGREYLSATFHGKGAPERTGPNREKGGLLKRGIHYVIHPADIARRHEIYRIRAANRQRDYVIFQEYIEHEYEWRVVRIGDSFFAHKKQKKGEKASGALIKIYEKPPEELLDFVREITDRHGFMSMAADIFESDRGFLVNEMQCIFGQSDPYQMLIDGKPGRYLWSGSQWIFEEGDFAANECFNLRLEYLLSRLR